MSRVARALLAVLAAWWLGAATSPVDLMPIEGRSQPVGAGAIVRLTQARGDTPARFGRRPRLDRESSLNWQLRWTGSAYEVRAAGAPLRIPPDGQLAFRRLDANGPLYIGAMMDPGTDYGRISFEYFLLWRLSAHEFIGYLRLFGSECEVLPAATLAAIGIGADDRDACTVRDWAQMEALMRAFAQTRPEALGTIRLLHHRLPPP